MLHAASTSGSACSAYGVWLPRTSLLAPRSCICAHVHVHAPAGPPLQQLNFDPSVNPACSFNTLLPFVTASAYPGGARSAPCATHIAHFHCLRDVHAGRHGNRRAQCMPTAWSLLHAQPIVALCDVPMQSVSSQPCITTTRLMLHPAGPSCLCAPTCNPRCRRVCHLSGLPLHRGQRSTGAQHVVGAAAGGQCVGQRHGAHLTGACGSLGGSPVALHARRGHRNLAP